MKEIFISQFESVKGALKKLDDSAQKVLLIVDEHNMLLGTLSDGDVRRHLLKGGNLDDSILKVYNKEPKTVKSDDIETLKKILLEYKIDLIPIVDEENKIIEIRTWDDVFAERREDHYAFPKLDLPVVFMAGGKGTRLKPFTNVLPKPLIPIGDKTTVELLIDNFSKYGISRYLFTINYKGEMIKAYFDSIEKNYSTEYIREKDFYGTAGSLKLLENIDDTFIVSNCDVIVKADYHEILEYHRENNSKITVISSIQHHQLPYGVINYKDGGEVTDIVEKPEYSFPINTGVYILESEVLNYIPENTVFHMTHLIQSVIKDNKKVFTYFVNEKDYIDIGQWDEYRKAVSLLE